MEASKEQKSLNALIVKFVKSMLDASRIGAKRPASQDL